jgi:hypothetical protein
MISQPHHKCPTSEERTRKETWCWLCGLTHLQSSWMTPRFVHSDMLVAGDLPDLGVTNRSSRDPLSISEKRSGSRWRRTTSRGWWQRCWRGLGDVQPVEAGRVLRYCIAPDLLYKNIHIRSSVLSSHATRTSGTDPFGLRTRWSLVADLPRQYTMGEVAIDPALERDIPICSQQPVPVRTT